MTPIDFSGLPPEPPKSTTPPLLAVAVIAVVVGLAPAASLSLLVLLYGLFAPPL